MRDVRLLIGALVVTAATTAVATAAPGPAPMTWPVAKAFERCVACHSAQAGVAGATGAGALGGAGVGPNLHSLAGRRAGSVLGFRYSGPMARSGLTWNAATLGQFLRDPQALVPGNRMAFSGLDDENELTTLLAFLLAPELETKTP